MKILAIIFSVIFIVSGVLFAVSLAADEVFSENKQEWSEFPNMDFDFDFDFDFKVGSAAKEFRIDESFTDINISILSSDATIGISKDGSARINYYPGNKKTVIDAYVSGDALNIKESADNWLTFSMPGKSGRIEILLPEHEYGRVGIKNMSGDVVGSNLYCGDAEIDSNSGDVKLKIAADNLNISNTSGSVSAENIGNSKIKSLKAKVTSGEVEIDGFAPEEYKLEVTSGELEADGLSGSGLIKASSGEISAEFAEWNGALEIQLTSGDIEIELPKGSGANTEVDRSSGKVRYRLDGESAELKSGTHAIGGDNKQNVYIKVTSGDIEITNK